jgi:hypothetical protein
MIETRTLSASSRLRIRRRQGMTVPEVMVGVFVGSLVLLVMASIFANSSKSFVAIGNYMEMNRASRNALDTMSRDIRNSKDLLSCTSTRLVFNLAGSTNLVYSFNAAAGQLTQWKTGDSDTNVLLSGCDQVVFNLYKNVPLSGGTNAPTSIASEAKCVGIAWKCSRSILGKKFNTEDLQQALIVIRNKPIL